LNSLRDYCWHHWFSIFIVQDDRLIYDTRRICLKVEFVGVVPNSLQDIGRASDGAKRRPVAEGLGRSAAESEAGPSGRTLVHTQGGCGGADPPAVRYIPLLGFRGDLILW